MKSEERVQKFHTSSDDKCYYPDTGSGWLIAWSNFPCGITNQRITIPDVSSDTSSLYTEFCTCSFHTCHFMGKAVEVLSIFNCFLKLHSVAITYSYSCCTLMYYWFDCQPTISHNNWCNSSLKACYDFPGFLWGHTSSLVL